MTQEADPTIVALGCAIDCLEGYMADAQDTTADDKFRRGKAMMVVRIGRALIERNWKGE